MATQFTINQYAAICEAFANGVTKVRVSVGPGMYHETEYTSLANMQVIMAKLEAELGLTSQQPRHSVARFSRFGGSRCHDEW